MLLSHYVMQRFAIMKPLPKASDEVQVVVDKLYEGMVKRENEAIEKLHGVIAFATADDCASSIALEIVVV